MKPDGPLQDIRFVEYPMQGTPLPLSLALAFAGRIAVDLGAQVSVAGRSRWDGLARIAPQVEGRGALSCFLDAGKRNLTSPDGANSAQAVARLLTGADVILCDHQTHQAFFDAAPNAVWAVISMFDPSKGDAGTHSEFTVMAACGLLDLVGEPLREPLRLGGHQLAYAAGLAVFTGVAGALCARARRAVPNVVRVNLADVAVWVNWKSVAVTTWSKRHTSRRGRDAEWLTLRCADGWVTLVCGENDWPALRELVGDSRLADPRFDDRNQRRSEAAFINDVVESAFAKLTRRELRERALAKRLPLGPVWSPQELEHDPQNVEREFLRRIKLESGQEVLTPRLPVLWNGRAPGQ